MARIVVLVLVASLAFVPAAEAAAPGRGGEAAVTGWLDVLRSAFDRLFAWGSSIRATPRRNGAYIVPNGIVDSTPTRGDSVRSLVGRSGAVIVPNGFAGPPPSSGSGGMRSLARKSGAQIIPNGIAGSMSVPGRGGATIPGGTRSPGP